MNGVGHDPVDLAKYLACEVRVVFSDVDGVFTDNSVLEGAPYKAKWRNYYDGQGVSLLRAIGIRICLITNSRGGAAKHIVDAVSHWNRLPSSKRGDWPQVKLYTGVDGGEKVFVAEDYLEVTKEVFRESAFMGDDLVDAALFNRVALRAAPISAEKIIRQNAHFVSERPGGSGAFRDFANFILESRGIDPRMLPLQ